MSEYLEQHNNYELLSFTDFDESIDRILNKIGVINREQKELSLREQGFILDPDTELYTPDIVDEMLKNTLVNIPLEIHTNKAIIMYNEVMVQESESDTDSFYDDDEFDETYIPLTRLYHDVEVNTYQEINPMDTTLTTAITDQMVITPPLKPV